jgi:cytoskeleton protein RodZ
VNEIGKTLREARTHRRLELADIAAVTRIRARYLAALEEERFAALPGRAYAKAFLRTYAQYLGLEAQPLVDHLDSRFTPEKPPLAPLPLRRNRPSRVPSPAVLLALGSGLAFVALLAAGGFSSSKRLPPLGQLASPPSPVRTHTQPTPSLPPPARAGPPHIARLVLTATRGDCWLLVRVGSETGRTLYEHTLAQGNRVSFTRSRLWIRIGAPASLSGTLNGRSIEGLAQDSGPTNVLVSPGGVRPA